MKCPICGDELRRSKKNPEYGLCDNCRKKIKLNPQKSVPNKQTSNKTDKINTNKPKYKTKKFKIVAACILLLFIIGVVGNIFGTQNESGKSDTTSQKETSTDTLLADAELDSNNVPSIKGSQAYDIILSLEDTGIPKAETVIASDGFQYDSTTSQYAYSIHANTKHEVMSAQFFVLDGTNGDGYLGFCASIPYDSAQSDSAQQWVNENVGSEVQSTFGDAIYNLSVGTQGPILTIKANGYDEYLKNTIIE